MNRSNYLIDLLYILCSSSLFLLSLLYTFYITGGLVGKIAKSKIITNEILSVTLIDFTYFIILLILSIIFLGLQLGFLFDCSLEAIWFRLINIIDSVENTNRFLLTFKESWKDFSKIMIGLGISLKALIFIRYLTGT